MKAVFFDKDGTLVKDVPYNTDPDLIELTTGAAEAVQKLKKAGWKVFVVSNQSGVARGFFAVEDLKAVWQKLNELCGVEFDGFYFCPHYESGIVPQYSFACDCRKPKAGLVLQAASEYNIDLQSSWMIGDSANDVEAGQRAGCQTILLGKRDKTLNERQTPTFFVENLIKAADLILKQFTGEISV
ncbi:MAG: HAD family hydrolase [Pyrinomonadaceae bacterium]